MKYRNYIHPFSFGLFGIKIGARTICLHSYYEVGWLSGVQSFGKYILKVSKEAQLAIVPIFTRVFDLLILHRRHHKKNTTIS